MEQDVLVWWLPLQTIPSALSELPTMQKLVVSYQKFIYMFAYVCLYQLCLIHYKVLPIMH